MNLTRCTFLFYEDNLEGVALLGLGRYGQQPIRYVFDTDLADTIRIRYDTHVHDYRFQSQEFCFNNKANVLG